MVKILAPDLLGSLLGKQDKLTIYFSSVDWSLIQIRNSEVRTLMTAIESGSRVTLTDMFGNTVLTYKLNHEDAVVTKNGRLFGTIQGVANKINFPGTFTAVDAHGEFMFEVERGNFKYQFFSGGSEIGTANIANLSNLHSDLRFSSAIDMNTKVMMIATTCHLIFVSHSEDLRTEIRCGWGMKAAIYIFIFSATMFLLFMNLNCLMNSVKLTGNATTGFEVRNDSRFPFGFGPLP
ncbi:unnamed protein product [Allacma fusca]|uniref:Uncharacterized protein n=1 Tax=Allacma fusca TaxID=39272 RepID=A0A8J2P3G0_9HEXA|nr:unnamed protein product [Allacma fusca]